MDYLPGTLLPFVLDSQRRFLVLSHHVCGNFAAAGLACVRQPRRSVGLRALDWKRIAERSGMAPGRLRHSQRQRTRVPLGSYPAGNSEFGVADLVGNGWEWTRTPFAPFPRFKPFSFYPGYSANFFDGKHFVMKGGS